MRKRLLSHLLRQKHEEWSRDSAQLASSEAAVATFNELDNFAELEERDGAFIIRGSAVRWPPWCLVIRRSAGSPKLCSRSKQACQYTPATEARILTATWTWQRISATSHKSDLVGQHKRVLFREGSVAASWFRNKSTPRLDRPYKTGCVKDKGTAGEGGMPEGARADVGKNGEEDENHK